MMKIQKKSNNSIYLARSRLRPHSVLQCRFLPQRCRSQPRAPSSMLCAPDLFFPNRTFWFSMLHPLPGFSSTPVSDGGETTFCFAQPSLPPPCKPPDEETNSKPDSHSAPAAVDRQRPPLKRRFQGNFSGDASNPPRVESWMEGEQFQPASYAHALSRGKKMQEEFHFVALEQQQEQEPHVEPCSNEQAIPGIEVLIDDKGVPCLCLNDAEKARIRKPWQMTLVVKLLGKTISFTALKRKLEQSWARDGSIQIIDVDNHFYFVKFSSKQDYDFALTGGPWVIFDHYLAVKKWEPNFKAATARINKIAVWVRFPELAVECYDRQILKAIGDLLGKTLKADLNTSNHARVQPESRILYMPAATLLYETGIGIESISLLNDPSLTCIC